MKKAIYTAILFFVFVNSNAFANSDPKNPNAVIAEMILEIETITHKFEGLIDSKQQELNQINTDLKIAVSTEQKVDLLLEKDRVTSEIRNLLKETYGEISKIRYLKGLQIIKILYEKILSLDHHFASVRTLNEINKISNPNQYPEFTKMKETMVAKRDKKAAFDLTAVLGTNPIVSVVQTFTNMISSSLSKDEKDKELANVDCILDFTLRMQNDLNTIYFETAFLQKSNDKMKEDIELLFKDYTKPIGYVETLEKCRTTDNWETVTQNMEDYLTKMKVATGTSQHKMQINIEFPIDRLLQFITQYNNFIDQGGKFYEKFKIILNSYENEKQCDSKLPIEYKKLKSDIDVAIQKFNVAYRPVEVNGTKMKEILYGLNEFE